MAKRRIIWSHRAKIDLFDILDFFHKRNGNKDYSKKLNKQIRAAVKVTSRHPEIGLKTDIQGVRNIIIQDYCIFYRKNEKNIEIITIWDSRQDPNNLII
jgi:addiction module RelE/StbE family toxin